MTTFDEQMVEAREAVTALGPVAACRLGEEDAVGERRSETPTIREVIDQIALDPVMADQMELALELWQSILSDVGESVAESYQSCFEERKATIEVSRVEAERRELVAVLPFVCAAVRYDGRYLDLDGRGVWLGRDVENYIELVFEGYDALPADWEQLTAVGEELERCAELPMLVIPGGTFLVGVSAR